MRRRSLAGLAGAAALACAAAAFADEAWRPLVDQDGVSVVERIAAGRTLPELRAVGEIDAGLFEVLAVISDIPEQVRWMHDCVESRLLRREAGEVSLLYNRTTAPWPVSDRDVVLRTETILIEPLEHAAVRFSNVSDPGTPEIDGFVRIPRLLGEYDLVALSPTRTRVTYTLDLDPGGSIPGWVAARTARETPLRTLLGLKNQVDATRGKYADFVTSWSARRSTPFGGFE